GGARTFVGYLREAGSFGRAANIADINKLFWEGAPNKIFLAHDPPLNYGDVSWFKRTAEGILACPPNTPGALHESGGCPILEIAIETLAPKLAVSGHFHGNPIAMEIGSRRTLTPGESLTSGMYVNPGTLLRNDMFSEGGTFAEVEIAQGGAVRYNGHRKVKR
ncbi:MAG: hypothetical protein HY366_02895, partial [Candidatus Aenigmarchaeota archaeon]|nr:hypothetical protein [Candidatus Aenigmarchaeota archaeon]